MKLPHLIHQIGVGFSAFCFITAAHAGVPYLTFSAPPGNPHPPQNVVGPTETILVQYKITNNYYTKKNNSYANPNGVTLLLADTSTVTNPTYNHPGVSLAEPCIIGYYDKKNKISQSAICTFKIDGAIVAKNEGGFLSKGPMLCEGYTFDSTSPLRPNLNLCLGPGPEEVLAINPLQITTKDLALSVKCGRGSQCAKSSPHLIGNPRTITITNRGVPTAKISFTTLDLPTGIHISSEDCNEKILGTNQSCTIVVQPGTTASSKVEASAGSPVACTEGGIALPGKISITATYANKVTIHETIKVSVLGYGCIYQGGYVYSVDDYKGCNPNTGAPPCIGSMGGKVVSAHEVDQYHTSWTSIDPENSAIWGIDYKSTPQNPSPQPSYSAPHKNCYGSVDGACNTDNIVSYYDHLHVDRNTYAAGKCAQYSTDASGNSPCTADVCYRKWYLPANCEWGYDRTSAKCVDDYRHQPYLQNIMSNLYNNGLYYLVDGGYYWTSTEDPTAPSSHAVMEFYGTEAQLFQYPKAAQFEIRCSRIF